MRRLPALAGAAFPVLGAALGLEVLATRVVRVRHGSPYRHEILAVGRDAVLLRRDRATDLPGSYGLAWPGGHGVLGPVLRADERTVLRRLERVQEGAPLPGPCALDHVEVGDPASALGLSYQAVEIPSEVGALPAWWVPGERRDAWVLFAHGLGGSLQSSLSFLPLVSRRGYNGLVVSYRNDPGAPPSADRRIHLGADEWRDVDAGIAFALAHGAEQVVLYGWSMGGGIALLTLARSPRRAAVRGLILDAPVVDWARVVRHVARRVPAPVVALVLWRVGRLIGVPVSTLDHLADADALGVPVLCFHGGRDEVVPVAHSRLLAERAPHAVDLVVDEGAGHVGSFNADPEAYEARVAAFLAQTLPAPGDPRTSPAEGIE